MKRKKSKAKDSFTASNGMTFEFAPDAKPDKPLTSAELKRVNVRSNTSVGITPEFLAGAKELKQGRGRGRPKVEHPKQPISFRFSAELVEHLQEVKGYNVRVEHLLHQAMIEGRL